MKSKHHQSVIVYNSQAPRPSFAGREALGRFCSGSVEGRRSSASRIIVVCVSLMVSQVVALDRTYRRPTSRSERAVRGEGGVSLS